MLVIILVKATKMSPNISGIQIIYSKQTCQFSINDYQCAKRRFQNRWILLLLIKLTYFIRIIMLKLDHVTADPTAKQLEILQCIVVICIISVVAERYRIGYLYPNDFVSFLNAAISIERNCVKGTLQITSM